ncbi:unnamed protein product [Chrysoparadoxa australica]
MARRMTTPLKDSKDDRAGNAERARLGEARRATEPQPPPMLEAVAGSYHSAGFHQDGAGPPLAMTPPHLLDARSGSSLSSAFLEPPGEIKYRSLAPPPSLASLAPAPGAHRLQFVAADAGYAQSAPAPGLVAPWLGQEVDAAKGKGSMVENNKSTVEAVAAEPEPAMEDELPSPSPLPPFPFRLEPHTHCYVAGSLQRVIQAISATFNSMGVDREKLTGSTWKAVKYCSGQFVDFRVSFFKPTSASKANGHSDGNATPTASQHKQNSYITEFQLRSGCRFEFRNLYLLTLEALRKTGCRVKPSKNLMPLAKAPTGPDSMLEAALAPPEMISAVADNGGDNHNSSSSTADAAGLLSMLRCCRVDSQLEAAKAASELSSTEQGRQDLASEEMIQALAALVTAPEPACDVLGKRCKCFAVFALSNLSEHHACQALIVESGAVPEILRVVCGLCADCPLSEREMKRESTRVLANLIAGGYKQVLEPTDAAQQVDSWLLSEDPMDPRVSMQRERIRAQLQDTC